MHKYVCEICKKTRGCNIAGCKGECIQLCTKCAKDKKHHDDYERLCDFIMKKGA